MSRTLKQWEAYLVGAMPRVQLLSELGLNIEDMQEIAGLIKQEIKKYPNLHPATRNLVKNYPSTLVSFLAAFAAQNTEREFWDALARLLDVSSGDLNNAKWRNHFIDILKKNKKPIFENISFLYVGNMRIHGGIPSYSLGDFFANMLMPAIEKPEYIELKGKELLDALFMRSAVQLFTDSTVRNFFEFSDDIGLEFLESSRRVAREYIAKRQISSDHNLPAYVVQKLITFLEYHEDEKHGLRRPRIQFDADEGLVLELPEQILSGTNVRGHEVRWQVYQGNNILREEKVRIASRGRASYTKETRTILGYILDPFQVSFSVATESGEFHQLREWTFDIRSQDVPNLLVFRKEDGSLLRWSQALPAQDLILVYPSDITLQFEGGAHLSHELNLQATGWHQWKAELWSLQNAWSLNIFKGDEKIAEIQIQKQLELPRLIGEIFAPNLDPKPLYVGAPPFLRIPLRSGVTVDDELKHWHVEINSTWEAEPFLHKVFKLSEKSESVIADDTAIQFSLAAVLGTEPKGTYALRVRGPLDTDIEFSFRVWPSLHITDLPEFILPSENQNITFHITLPVSAKLEILAGSVGISVTSEDDCYSIELDETASRVDLNLIWPHEDLPIHVPFSLPISRLEWRFVLGEDSKLEWSNRPIRKPVDAFLQSTQTAALLVHMPGIENHTRRMALRLIDPEKPKEFLQEFPLQISVLGGDHVRFVLNAKDTICQHTDISIFEFQLLIANAEGLYQPVTLLSFTRDLEVSNVRTEESEESVFLLWDESVPLRSRRVFIRSMWKPWANSWNIKIPGEARGKYNLLAAGYSLPPSWYEIHFYIAPSWEPDITSAPEGSAHIVRTISPENQIGWLDKNLLKRPETSFVNHLERACIYVTLGETAKRDQEIQFCYSHIEQTKPKDLFAFHEWLGKYDPETARAVCMKMYYPEQLQRLYNTYKPGEDFRQEYQSHVPKTSIKPESAILIIENENERPVIFHALRELIKNRDNRFVKILAGMVEDGRISDADAIGLLRLDEAYLLNELNSSQPTTVNLRLLSGLLHEKDELLSTLSNDKIISLINVEQDSKTINKYLGILITREDKRGVELVMDRFQKGLMLGGEVTGLLGKNPRFSFQVLSNASQIHAHSIQLSELARKYPIETGHIATKMFVHTPCGWGRIDSIKDASGLDLQFVSIEEKQCKLHTTLYPNTSHSLEAILDVENEKMNILGAEKFYQCGLCGFVATTQNFIIRDHTRESHGGMGASFSPIPPRLPIRGELKFSQTYPA